MLKEVLLFKPDGGARGRGRPRLRFYDTVKADLLERDVLISARNQPGFWQVLIEMTGDRAAWQKIVNWRR